MPKPLLEVRDLHVKFKVYEGWLQVLNGVALSVEPGQRVGLVGEAGCGKTTTMKCILRILPSPPGKITAGEIRFHGQDILKMPIRAVQRIRGRTISMIFQDPTAALNPVFTIGDQLQAVIRHGSRNSLTRKEIRDRAVAILQEVQLPDPERIITNYPIQLSGGMRQRICIAMALSTEPELLIADEPTTSLDVTIQDQVLRLLHDLVVRRGTSVIFITHSLGVVREMADLVYVMYAGCIVEGATKDRLFARPLHPYTVGLMSAVPKLTGGGIAMGIPGRIPDYLNPPVGCRFSPRCPHAMEECARTPPRLLPVAEDREVACFLYQRGDNG